MSGSHFENVKNREEFAIGLEGGGGRTQVAGLAAAETADRKMDRSVKGKKKAQIVVVVVMDRNKGQAESERTNRVVAVVDVNRRDHQHTQPRGHMAILAFFACAE